MMRGALRMLAAGMLSLGAVAQEANRIEPDPPITCWACETWNAPHEPFRVFGNTYYVGVAGLSAILITSDGGHVLLDGALPQSVPLIEGNIRALGFRPSDVRLIAASHEHYDHVGGIAALQRATGAAVAAGEGAVRALEQGEPTPADPQYGLGREARAFPPVRQVRGVRDGETLRVGPLAITAHATPGHTPGSTSWTWTSCEGSRCLDLVYADSLNPVSAPGFRFSDDPARVEAFRRSIEKVRTLPCDILLSVHPEFTGMAEKLARRAGGAPDAFVDRGACRTYADAAARSLTRRLGDER